MYHDDNDLLDMLREVVEAFAPPFELYESMQTGDMKARNARLKVKEALIKLINGSDEHV